MAKTWHIPECTTDKVRECARIFFVATGVLCGCTDNTCRVPTIEHDFSTTITSLDISKTPTSHLLLVGTMHRVQLAAIANNDITVEWESAPCDAPKAIWLDMDLFVYVGDSAFEYMGIGDGFVASESSKPRAHDSGQFDVLTAVGTTIYYSSSSATSKFEYNNRESKSIDGEILVAVGEGSNGLICTISIETPSIVVRDKQSLSKIRRIDIGEIPVAMMIFGDSVVVAFEHGIVERVSISRGRRLWRTSISPEEITPAAVLIDDILICGTMSGQITQLNVTSGKIRKSVRVSRYGVSALSANEAYLVVGTRSGEVRCFAWQDM